MIEVPKKINMLHLRQTSTGETYFCSTDGRFKLGNLWLTQKITKAGLGEVVNDTRFIFERGVINDLWILKCRVPSL